MIWRAALAWTLALPGAAQEPRQVVVIANQNAPVSERIAEHYLRARSVPPANLCRIRTSAAESVSRQVYEQEIEQPVARFLAGRKLSESVLFLVTTLGVPLRVQGAVGKLGADGAAVDSELTLLYAKLHGERFPAAGIVPNPYYRATGPFSHPHYRIYLVTRLAGYDFADVQQMIDRSLQARNRGRIILDLKSDDHQEGNQWMREAARQLPPGRVVLETSPAVLYDQKDVIGYCAWGSNDPNRKRRGTGFHWLPGALATEYVSTNGRTFARPPDDWTLSTWREPARWFAGSPQTLAADYVHEGVTGSSGHIDEPFLQFTARPQYLFPHYLAGRTLAEAYYSAMPALSWQNIVLGDPLCCLRP